MRLETKTSLGVAEVLELGKRFFAERMPHHSAFLEREEPGFITLRGQGGEEISLAASDLDPGAYVSASSMFYGQAIARFFSTLPRLEETS
ncbi:MAG: hypothetical protein ACE5HT_08750 [Gemmatimonadales bacterium]